MWDADSLRNMGGCALQSGHSSNDFLVLPYPSDDYVLMQYTGLLDKQGVEIYEGDIVKVHSYTVTGLGKVGFNKGSFVFNKFEYPTSQVLHSFSEIEVIGNIYEHSHLLDNN